MKFDFFLVKTFFLLFLIIKYLGNTLSKTDFT